jgi:hypothetical protein
MIRKVLLSLVLLSAWPALATTLIVNNIDTATGVTPWSLWIDIGGAPTNLWFAGGIDVTVGGYNRILYCVDLLTDINVPGTYTTALDFSDTVNLKRVGWLMQNEWPSTSGYSGAALQRQGSAFQLAIWDILQDGGDGFGTNIPGGAVGLVSQSTGPNPTTPDVLAAAIQYEADSILNGVPLTSPYGDVYKIWDLNGHKVQTLMGPTPDDGGPNAPEPAAVILIFSGLALIGLSRLRHSAHTN